METVIELISGTTTTGGLRVAAVVDTNMYPTKTTVSHAEIQALHLVRETFHGEWNYALYPQWMDTLFRRVSLAGMIPAAITVRRPRRSAGAGAGASPRRARGAAA